MTFLSKTVLVFLMIFLISCSQKEEIKIGISAPLSGLAANLGQNMLNGINLAYKEENDNYNLIIEDDQCDSKTGITVTQKLIEIDQVDAILGPICTVAILSSAPYVEDSKIPRITTGMVVQKVANAGDYHFSFLPEMKHQMKTIMSYAKENNLNKIGAIAINDELGRESINELKQFLSQGGTEFTGEEYFERSETESKLKARSYHQSPLDL